MDAERVAIGQITAPHGVHGQVRVFPLTDFPERWRRLTEVYVGDEPAPRPMRLKGFIKDFMPVIELAGVGDRAAAERLRGAYLRVPLAATHPLPENTFYIFQLRGLAVVDPDGAPLGRVADVETSPANDLVVVELPDGRRARIPLVRAFVLAVEPAAGRLVVRPIPGLLE